VKVDPRTSEVLTNLFFSVDMVKRSFNAAIARGKEMVFEEIERGGEVVAEVARAGARTLVAGIRDRSSRRGSGK